MTTTNLDFPMGRRHGGFRTIAFVSMLAIVLGAGWFLFTRREGSAAPQKASNSTVSSAAVVERQLSSSHRKMDSVTFSPDGKLLAAIEEEASLDLFDTASGAIVQQVSDSCCTMASVAFSPDATQIAIGMNDDTGARIRVLRAEGGKFRKIVREIRQRSDLVHSVAFSSDGRQLLTEIDADAILWNLDDGVEVERFEAGVNGVCALSPDTATLITAGSNANEVKLWDVSDGTRRVTLRGHTEGLLSVAISPNGVMAASGGYDSTARLWEIRSGASEQVLKHGEVNPVFALAFSHSGSDLATASDAVRVWNVNTGARKRMFHRADINSLAYSADDYLLAGASRDGGVYLWQLSKEVGNQ